MRKNRKYGFRNFLFDTIMVVVTGSFWILWIFIREMQKKR